MVVNKFKHQLHEELKPKSSLSSENARYSIRSAVNSEQQSVSTTNNFSSVLTGMQSGKSDVIHTVKKLAIRKRMILLFLGMMLVLVSFLSLNIGAISIPCEDVIKILLQHETQGTGRIVWDVRMPRIIAAILVGAGLSISGTAMQSILRNPLASPYTLGLSNAAAFGASCAIVFFNAGTQTTTSIIINNPYIVSVSAFTCSALATFVILVLAKLTRISPESMVLSGIAIGALFSAGLTFMQYLADSIQLATIISWSFGDLGRANWNIIKILLITLLPVFVFFLANRWDFNALDTGEETAKSLGVQTERLRIMSMLASSLLSALIVSAFGIIAFIGLLGPHIGRRIIGKDHRYLFLSAPLTGAILMVSADMLSQQILYPMVLPVGIVTSMLGAPLFIYLLLRSRTNGTHR